ncbi:hypothetical protein Ptr86124_010861 [Pyrenophora tritici-repentis]|uniref:Uncharacterized protein n=1 Tax=Pyrenophora tritici-repentis TaxID=45151 RepID=A0A922SV54_9PLEO|nr:hypothetical protein Ptr86124_010861 [Pyrenophora tritici-repentis]
MVNVNRSLSSALELIKRFAFDWVQVSDAVDCDDLVALVDALDRLKKDAEQRLSIKKATQASMNSDRQSTHKGSANQGIRRSQRIATADSLFVTETETESESGVEDNLPFTMLHEASPNEHTTRNAARGVMTNNLVLLPDHFENQSPIEEHYRTEMPEEEHPIEQGSPSLTLYTTRSFVNEQDERTRIHPIQVLDGDSNAHTHQTPDINTQNQAAEDPDHIDRQPGPESPHHSLVNHPHQDATAPPLDGSGFGEITMHDFASPQFFNSAFEDYRLSSLNHESPTNVEEATAGSYRQHLIDPDHTEPVQVLDGESNAQAYQTPDINTQNQAAEDPDHIDRQPGPDSPHHSVVNHPHQDATTPPSDEFAFEEVPSPQFFNEAFGDFYLNTPHHEPQTDAEEATTASDERNMMYPVRTESFGNDPIVQGYVDLACRLSFRLPHKPVEDADHLDPRELLSPLVEERPLTSTLIHGLIYTLLPGPLCIFEVCSSELDPESSSEGSPAEDFVAIIRRDGEALPLLVIGVETSKKLYVLDSETVDLASLGTSWLIGPEWTTEYINPRYIAPHVESTLLSVWIAEAYFLSRRLENFPSSRDLRLRFLGELLAPYQRDSILEKYGISSNHTGSQHIDSRPRLVHLETQVQTHKICIQNLENFEHGALREALDQMPAKIELGRCLRILQCVDEIGSPRILDSLKLACARNTKDQTYQDMEQPLFQKLFYIHIHLDKLENESHLLVARERFIKYCYFETYMRAVRALQETKRNSYQERQRVLARKRTASFKNGISEELPPTPHTEEINRVYYGLSPSGRTRRAPDMVKDEICSKLVQVYGGNQKRVRRKINKYISQGRVLHHVLQGGRSLDPGLLVLFPSSGADPPTLSMAKFGLELDELEENALSKPIELKDIDTLTVAEAVWFGKVLQARPELLDPVPKTVLDLISDSLTHDLDLQERDAESFRDCEMKTEPGNQAIEEDAWSCLGAISIDRLNILVFWECSWLSADEYHALHQDGHQGWLVHTRGEDQLLIAWEPTMEAKSIQSSPHSLLYEPAIEVRKDRPGLLGYVAAKFLLDSSNAALTTPYKRALYERDAIQMEAADALENIFNNNLESRAPDSKFAAIYEHLKANEALWVNYEPGKKYQPIACLNIIRSKHYNQGAEGYYYILRSKSAGASKNFWIFALQYYVKDTWHRHLRYLYPGRCTQKTLVTRFFCATYLEKDCRYIVKER